MNRTIPLLLAATLVAPAAFAQSTTITSSEDRPGMMGSEDYFTGTAFVEPVFDAEGPFVVNAGSVTFLPGARTAWHTHPAGQQLIVTSGTGWIQVRGEEKQTIRAGDVVWFPPEVEHWHGATEENSMTHIAIQQFENEENVVWGEHVTDAEYAQ